MLEKIEETDEHSLEKIEESQEIHLIKIEEDSEPISFNTAVETNNTYTSTYNQSQTYSNNNHKTNYKTLIIAVSALAFVLIITLYAYNSSKRKSAALSFVQNLANQYSCSEQYLRNELANVGYSNSEINYAINTSDYNYDMNALYYIMNYTNTDSYLRKNTITDILMSNGFTQGNIDYALDNINWDDMAYRYANTLTLNYQSSKNDILNNLSSQDLTQEEFDNIVSYIDWNTQCLNNLNYIIDTNPNLYIKKDIINILYSYGYSKQEVEYASNSYNWDYLIQNAINNLMNNNEVITIKEVKKELVKYGFDENTVNFYLSNANFSYFAQRYAQQLEKQLKNKNGYVTRSQLYDALETAEFSYDDIRNAIYSISNWQIYANNYLEKLISKGEYDKYELENKMFNQEFEEYEISNAMSYMSWPDVATSYLKKLIEDGHYDQSELEMILYNCNYTSSEISVAMNRMDWTGIAKKLVQNYYSKEQFKYDLQIAGYTTSQINSAVSSTDWKAKAIHVVETENCQSRPSYKDLLYNYGYSNEEINYAIRYANVDWEAKAYAYIIQIYGSASNAYTYISNVSNDLSYYEFTSSEISNVISRITNEAQ